MFSSNTKLPNKQHACSVMGVDVSITQGFYLGLPSLVGRNKKQIFQFIRERLSKRLSSWKNKLLSRSGKKWFLILLKVVILNLLGIVFVLLRSCGLGFVGDRG
ncbi:hypothetical protein PVK06_046848 [Gossypium arboreum]|uniref:Uncharacterized protein n=1 Tax=Gossypium arboreum TaxID=29729 RepID=A0ABR0MBT0_GOSAR|nr:hypothetical protein PVK06_046848 [Gossypium arboreum]